MWAMIGTSIALGIWATVIFVVSNRAEKRHGAQLVQDDGEPGKIHGNAGGSVRSASEADGAGNSRKT